MSAGGSHRVERGFHKGVEFFDAGYDREMPCQGSSTAGRRVRGELAQRGNWILEVHEDESTDHRVESRRIVEIVNRRAAEFNIRCRDVPARKGERAGIHVNPDGTARRAYEIHDDPRDFTDTAANVEYAHAVSDSGLLKSNSRIL